MNCPGCGESANGRSVVKTFVRDDSRIRYRRCTFCGSRFRTVETIVTAGEDSDSLPVARRLAAGIKNLLDAEGFA